MQKNVKPLKAARSTYLLRQTGKQQRVKVLENYTVDSSVVCEELRASEGHPASTEDSHVLYSLSKSSLRDTMAPFYIILKCFKKTQQLLK